MDIFISWSGPKSEAVAKALHGWLPKIINAFKPWLSSADIDKGARWSSDVATRLQAAKAGIICVTPSNLHSDWILFEAGALSKTLQNTFVCPLLIGLEPADVKGPLAQFQATRTTKSEVMRLLKTLNGGLGDAALPDGHIEEAFDVWWPKLEAEFKGLPEDNAAARPHRSERDILEEILSLVRNQNRAARTVPPRKAEPDLEEEPLHERVYRILLDEDPAVTGMRSWDGSNGNFTAQVSHDSSHEEFAYTIDLPKNIPQNRLRDLIKKQIPKPPRRRSSVKSSSGGETR